MIGIHEFEETKRLFMVHTGANSLLSELSNSPELKVLKRITDHNYPYMIDPPREIESSQWDEVTKKSVLSLWLMTEASEYRANIVKIPRTKHVTNIAQEQERRRKRAEEAEARARKIQDPPTRTLSIETEAFLITQVVDRKLQPKKTQEVLPKPETTSVPLIQEPEPERPKSGPLQFLRSKLPGGKHS